MAKFSSGPRPPVGFEVRDGRIIVPLLGGALDVTDAVLVSLDVQHDTVDVTQLGSPHQQLARTGMSRVTLELALPKLVEAERPSKQAPEKPQEPRGETKRLSVPPEGQSSAQRILGRLRDGR